MKHFAFKTVVENQLDRSREVLLGKAEEYSSAQDRLHNFRVAAKLQGVSEKEALGGMMSKHTVSIFDMIRDDEDVNLAMWDEKITDHINYLLLLRAMVAEDLAAVPLDPGSETTDFPENIIKNQIGLSRSFHDEFNPNRGVTVHSTYNPLESGGPDAG